ncbi:unnamed protein product, partial [Discosporangium mesarthrocarpum]
KLVSLRLVGLGLTEVPSNIGAHLWSLHTVSFASNQLTELPDSLCDLTALKELNLQRNKLRALPDRFGNLLKLDEIYLTSNRLESLPPSFGNLTRLRRLVLDCNRLRRLPETLGRMMCSTLSISSNRLVGLPHCIKDMQHLKVLSANDNGLHSLPSDIGKSKSITEIHLCSNRLNQLPDSICQLGTLQMLWLDHNCISALPMNFHKLRGLQRLLLEGNKMVYPPVEVVLGGCKAVRVWCSRRLEDRIEARKHTIVMTFQDLLKQVHRNRGLANPAFFEGDVQIGSNKYDHYYALVYDKFWDEMLPALEKASRARGTTEWAEDISGPRGRGTSFDYTREEVDRVLREYRDPAGRVMRTQMQTFRRCGCIDAQGRRRVCVPPKVGWMCERKATLIKHDIILEREQAERQKQVAEQEDIDFRIQLAKKIVKEHAETPEGKIEYARKAIKIAEELTRQKEASSTRHIINWRLGEFASEADALVSHRKEVLKKKFASTREGIVKEREHRVNDIQAKISSLKEEAEKLRGWGRDQKEAEIDKAVKSLQALPEDKKLEEVDQQLQEELRKLDENVSLLCAGLQEGLGGVLNTVKRSDKKFQELVTEMTIDLVEQDMEREGEAADRKHVALQVSMVVLRRIMAMWVGLGMRDVFSDWKTWTKRRIRQRRKDARQARALRQAWHQYEADKVVVVMAEWKLSFWEEHWDEYNDCQYWTHRDSGEIRYGEVPSLVEYIPEGYKAGHSL